MSKVRDILKERILVLDGAMGTMLQKAGLTGNSDMFSITNPEVVKDIHRQYLEAGADIISTNTFGAQRISQAEYGTTDKVQEMNRASVRLARQLCDEYTAKNPEKPRFVAGSVGPTGKMLSMSEDVNDPASRAITFDELSAAYEEQIRVMVEEGVDIILVETIFDTLNAKAAISAFWRGKKEKGKGKSYPEIMLSLTISDASGRSLSGQTPEAFVTSVMHANPLAVGLNCGLGAAGLLPWLRRLSAAAPCFVSCHPNAGLPDQEGQYTQRPEEFANEVQTMFDERLLNIIGGCCGTTPEHIAAICSEVEGKRKKEKGKIEVREVPEVEGKRKKEKEKIEVREVPEVTPGLHLAGLEEFCFDYKTFVKVGERCNVAGSRKFLRLVNEKKYDEALEIARKQVEDGAMVIDVNMDDGLLDSKEEMQTFLNLLASDPAVCRVPVMVDSSRFEVIEAGLKCLQGKGIVNSLSLKMGEEELLEHARVVKQLGAAVIFMCFDEEGQATDYDRRVKICQRAYRLLTEEVGFRPDDIIFDPNVLTVATGMEEHNQYAADFIRATRWIHDNLPGTRISGGLSNLSFAFRGNNFLREAMHSCFLHLAIPQGMNMAILNPATMVDYQTIPTRMRLAILEVLLATDPEALADPASLTEEPVAGASSPASSVIQEQNNTITKEQNNVSIEPAAVLKQCLVKGTATGLQENLLKLIEQGKKPVEIISGPLMEGMNEVGRLFGEGKMFLPQVVKTARTMKQAVEVLNPYMNGNPNENQNENQNYLGKVLLATVKGDVHDIGKNIVGVVLACNNFEVIDLGVMVPPETIVSEAIAQKVDAVCLSGLITPSLEEMRHVAEQMQQAGLTIPIMVGGATTSPKHTALKLVPCYDGPVFHVRDAAQNPALLAKLMDPAQRESVIAENRAKQQAVLNPKKDQVSVKTLIPYIDWLYFFWAWRTKEESEVGQELKRDAMKLLQELADAPDDLYATRFQQKFYPAVGDPVENTITVQQEYNQVVLPTPRQTEDCLPYKQAMAKGEPYRLKSLADFLSTAQEQEAATSKGEVLPDYRTQIGAFACTMSPAFVERLEKLKKEQGGGDYDVLLLQTIGDRLAEATAEYIAQQMQKERGWQGIRPAVGYPSWPEQRNMFLLAQLVDMKSLGIRLTENGAMYPQASVSGLYLGSPEAEYFTL